MVELSFLASVWYPPREGGKSQKAGEIAEKLTAALLRHHQDLLRFLIEPVESSQDLLAVMEKGFDQEAEQLHPTRPFGRLLNLGAQRVGGWCENVRSRAFSASRCPPGVPSGWVGGAIFVPPP